VTLDLAGFRSGSLNGAGATTLISLEAIGVA